MENEKEKFEFQAETKQLLNLMINSRFPTPATPLTSCVLLPSPTVNCWKGTASL